MLRSFYTALYTLFYTASRGKPAEGAMMMTEYFGPIWEGSEPVRKIKIERLATGASVELTIDEFAMLQLGISNAIEVLENTGYGRGDSLRAQYQDLLEKLWGI